MWEEKFGKDWIHIDEANFNHIDHNDILDFPIKTLT